MSPKVRLTKEQREQATQRVLAGENQQQLAEEYGCTRAYISLLKAEALNPERYEKLRQSKRTRMLSEAETKRLEEAVRTSNPYELNLDPPLLRWDTELIEQLALRWFEKKPSVRALKELLSCVPVEKHDPLYRRPQPPPKHHISQLSRELAQDKEFVQYYLSPASERLAWRQYELALADWKQRFGDVEYAYPGANPESEEPEEDAEEDMKFPAFPLPRPAHQGYGQRVGKHAKGNTNQKKRKKRKGKRR